MQELLESLMAAALGIWSKGPQHPRQLEEWVLQVTVWLVWALSII